MICSMFQKKLGNADMGWPEKRHNIKEEIAGMLTTAQAGSLFPQCQKIAKQKTAVVPQIGKKEALMRGSKPKGAKSSKTKYSMGFARCRCRACLSGNVIRYTTRAKSNG